MKDSDSAPIDPRLKALADGSIAAITAYDYPSARLIDEAGVDLILVGDTLGMVFAGMEDTTGVTMEHMLYHLSIVRRGVKNAVLVGDLPYASYDTPELALKNARRLMEAGADAVKLEGGLPVEAQIRTIREAGIPLVGHIGMLPQQIKIDGVYRKKGKTPEDAARLLEDARLLEECGACAMVLEGMVPSVAARITQEFSVPTIGIGAGSDCDGEITVYHDLIGLYPWFTPPFATKRADFAGELQRSVTEYVAAVRERSAKV